MLVLQAAIVFLFLWCWCSADDLWLWGKSDGWMVRLDAVMACTH